MPTYEYECAACGHRFDAFQSITAKPLKKCPDCGNAVVKLISVTGKPRENLLTPSNLAGKGFTQYKNAGGGHFEKSAGKGPDVLSSE